jgi:uncharacterized protein (DUF1684 family)
MRKDADKDLLATLQDEAMSVINAHWPSDVGNKKAHISKPLQFLEQQREASLELLSLYLPVMDDAAIYRAMRTARHLRGETRYW